MRTVVLAATVLAAHDNGGGKEEGDEWDHHARFGLGATSRH